MKILLVKTNLTHVNFVQAGGKTCLSFFLAASRLKIILKLGKDVVGHFTDVATHLSFKGKIIRDGNSFKSYTRHLNRMLGMCGACGVCSGPDCIAVVTRARQGSKQSSGG